MNPATKIMNAIFGGELDDRDLIPGIHDKLIETLEGMRSNYKNGNPRFTDRHCRVLYLRFGFEDKNYYTLRQIGQKLNLSPERIRQIETKILRMLRHPSRSRSLRDFIIKGDS